MDADGYVDPIQRRTFDIVEVLGWWWYDTFTVDKCRTGKLYFGEQFCCFQDVEGGPAKTNLGRPRRIPFGNVSWVDGISFIFDRDISEIPWVQDVLIEFRVNNVPILKSPLRVFQRYVLNPKKMPASMEALVLDARAFACSVVFQRPIYINDCSDLAVSFTHLGDTTQIDRPSSVVMALHCKLFRPPTALPAAVLEKGT